MKIKKIKYLASVLFSSFLFFFIFTNNSYAYLDPGTGALIFQAILGAFAAVGAFIMAYWKKLKKFFKEKSIFSRTKK